MIAPLIDQLAEEYAGKLKAVSNVKSENLLGDCVIRTPADPVVAPLCSGQRGGGDTPVFFPGPIQR